MHHPSRPAILYMHYWPAAQFTPPFLNDEDLVDVLLKYYSIPTLSLKNAIHDLLLETPQLMDELWWPKPDDKIHPTCIGARYARLSQPCCSSSHAYRHLTRISPLPPPLPRNTFQGGRVGNPLMFMSRNCRDLLCSRGCGTRQHFRIEDSLA